MTAHTEKKKESKNKKRDDFLKGLREEIIKEHKQQIV